MSRGHRVKDDCSTVMNMNYMTGMEKGDSELFRISPEQRKPSILLHACCGPCSTACVERLAPDYSITVYYYNPNITDREEYYLRRDTLLQFIKAFNEEHKDSYYVSYMEGEYDPEFFLDIVFESYSRSLYIDTGVDPDGEYEKKARKFAEELGFRHDCRTCDLKNISSTIRRAKELAATMN